MPEPKEHAERRGRWEEILKHIPGFKGYLEKENRRESDALQRAWLGDRLQRGKRGLETLTRKLADRMQFDLLPECDRLRGRIDALIGRVKGAMHGYSGIFDLVRIDEAVLDKVYEYDLSLAGKVDAAGDLLEQLAADPADAAQRLADVFEQIDRLQLAWDAREDILKGLD